MRYDPHKRDATWNMIQPGCYVDPANRVHIFPDEILAYLEICHPEAGFDPNSKNDYDLVVDAFISLLKRDNPETPFRIIKHARDEN